MVWILIFWNEITQKFAFVEERKQKIIWGDVDFFFSFNDSFTSWRMPFLQLNFLTCLLWRNSIEVKIFLQIEYSLNRNMIKDWLNVFKSTLCVLSFRISNAEPVLRIQKKKKTETFKKYYILKPWKYKSICLEDDSAVMNCIFLFMP